MRYRIQSITVMLCLTLWSYCDHSFANKVKVGLLLTGKPQLRNLENIANNFEQQTGTNVEIVARHDAEYKNQLKAWLESDNPPDIVNWQAGRRLQQFVAANQVLPITQLWQDNNWDSAFSGIVREHVEFNKDIYAVPYYYYAWGLYFRRSVFDEHQVAIPESWDQLLNLCDTFKQKGIIPFAIGLKDKWTAQAWFDYINLRTNGIEFHRQLTLGKISFLEDRVREVFSRWHELIHRQCFFKHADEFSWNEIFPYLYHKRAAMTLMGGFASAQFNEKIKQDFRLIPFPTIDATTGRYEEAPIDVMFIPAKAQNPKTALAFLSFLSQPENVERMLDGQAVLPVHTKARIDDNHLAKSSIKIITESDGLTQYFDRDVTQKMDELATPILAKFMTSGDIEATISALESARLEAY